MSARSYRPPHGGRPGMVVDRVVSVPVFPELADLAQAAAHRRELELAELTPLERAIVTDAEASIEARILGLPEPRA